MLPYIAYMDPMGLSDCCFMPRRETDQFLVPLFSGDDIDGSQNPESESVESVKTTKNVICLSHFFYYSPKNV